MTHKALRAAAALVAATALALAPDAAAQTDDATWTPPETLFKYPTVPDTMSTLESRTNYLITHFWENFDLSKPIRDSIGFDSAFRDYIDLFRYAHRTVVFSSINDFMNKAQSNTANMIFIIGVVESALYSAGAAYWSDEVYLPFIKFFVDSKMIKNEYKLRYKEQITAIENTPVGAAPPDFTITKTDKSKVKLSDISGWTLIYFNEPDCFDCTLTRLRLSTDSNISLLVDSGQITVVSVCPGGYSAEWASEAASMPENWINGYCQDIDQTYDIRLVPSFYLLDKDHKIVNKNMALTDVQALLGQ